MRRRGRTSGRRAAAFVSSVLALRALAPGLARADEAAPRRGSFSIDRFDSTPPGDRFESVLGANIDGEELFRSGLTLEYANAPLVVRQATVVEHQLVLHPAVSLAVWERVLMTVALPIVLVNQGGRRELAGAVPVTVAAPNEASVGNILLGARVRLVGTPHDEVEIAAGGQFWLPTGRPEELTGDLRLRAMPYASASGAWRRLAYASHVGVLFQRSRNFVDVHLGPELRFGLAAAALLGDGRAQLGPELAASVPFSDGAGAAVSLASVELLATGRLRIGDMVLGAGFGPGLVRGVGTPRFRGLATVAFAPIGERDGDRDGVIDLFDACPTVKGVPDEDPERSGCPPNRDADAVLDAADACPDEPGIASTDPRRNGCPVATDRDGDAIPDKLDACPDDRGAASDDPRKNGCPSDRDGDGVLDAEDTCPDEAGVASGDPARRGCPADADGDGIADAQDACPAALGGPSVVAARNGCPHDDDGDGIDDSLDACPHERGAATSVRATTGCPARVRFAPDRIELLQELVFAPGSNRVSTADALVLQDVASVLNDHPEVRLEVESAPGLEAGRAAAVVRWLGDHGVARSRLQVRRLPGARGLGLRVVESAAIAPDRKAGQPAER